LIAGGALPNISTDAQYSTAGITALQLLASLENIEAFFYADAIQKLTSGVYMTGDLSLNDTIEVISKIAAVCSSIALENDSGHLLEVPSTCTTRRNAPALHQLYSLLPITSKINY
jgi:hypothetical protein